VLGSEHAGEYAVIIPVRQRAPFRGATGLSSCRCSVHSRERSRLSHWFTGGPEAYPRKRGCLTAGHLRILSARHRQVGGGDRRARP
jgi:hypothetical protein